MRKWIAGMLLALAALSAPRVVRRRPAVKPSESIEVRIRTEVARAAALMDKLDPGNLCDSPYLVSAVYYHDGLLDGFPASREDAEPSRRIITQVLHLAGAEFKMQFVEMLRSRYDEAFDGPPPARLVPPVKYSPASRRRRRGVHRYAVDLFTREGSTVVAAARGIVVLADGNWNSEDPFSTASRRGGNAVIIFDAATNRFYRYCHLDRVLVKPYQAVQAEHPIATVGHTGLNASRRGHGGHLHFEINECKEGRVKSLTRQQIWNLIPK